MKAKLFTRVTDKHVCFFDITSSPKQRTTLDLSIHTHTFSKLRERERERGKGGGRGREIV